MADRFDKEAEKLLPCNLYESCETAEFPCSNCYQRPAVAQWGRELADFNKINMDLLLDLESQLARAERDWQEERQAVVELRKQLSEVNRG